MSEVQIYSDLPEAPARKRGGNLKPRGEKFPYSKLEVGQGFYIEATDKHPTPWKSYASGVSAAQRRFATADGVKSRKNRKTGENVEIQNWVPTRKFKIFEAEVTDDKDNVRSVACVKREK